MISNRRHREAQAGHSAWRPHQNAQNGCAVTEADAKARRRSLGLRQPEDDAPRLSLPLGKGMPQRPTWQELTRHLVFVEHVRVSTLSLSPGHDDGSDPPVNKIEALGGGETGEKVAV